jgi:magnesium-transporting ATPase (P-type)
MFSDRGVESSVSSPADRPQERWHAVAGPQALERLSSPEGLDSAEAQRRLAEHGPNELTRRRGPSAWAVLLRQFTSPLIYALLVSAAVAFALGEIPDGSVVLGVVVLNAIIGFVQEYRAGRAIQALAQLVSEPATVRRDGEWTQLPAEQLVPGDLVSVDAGGRIVADLRILDAHGLRADESALTGESVPVDKATAPVGPDAELAERSSMLHGGTLATSGTAQAVVVETGDHTQLGRISGLIDTAGDTQTPLTRNIAGLGSSITKIIGVVAVALLGMPPWPRSRWPSRPFPKGCPRSSRSPWPSACSEWRGGGRWSGSCRRWRPWVRRPWCAPTRPAR